MFIVIALVVLGLIFTLVLIAAVVFIIALAEVGGR